MTVNGNIDGLKQTIIDTLESLYEMEIPQDRLWTEELVTLLSQISGTINREISLYLDRKGHVLDVSVGDHRTVSLMEFQGRRNQARLSGIRCIHTHPNGVGMLSTVDLSSLKLLKLDMIAAIGVQDTQPTGIFMAVLSAASLGVVDTFGPFHASQDDFQSLIQHIEDAEAFYKNQGGSLSQDAEKAILVGIKTNETRLIQGVSEAEISMDELSDLAETAGAVVVARVIQKREGKDSAYFIGKGKIDELGLLVQTEEADLVIFDEEISPSQQRNVEEALGVKVLDRTGLILDIFAQRARSREGKLQVELAQLEYLLPRLSGQGTALSRLGGGIGTRGPGETKLETDRRHIHRKIDYLKEQLKEVKRQRGVLRVERKKNRIPTISLVGYTNAGKSSLLNALCGADVYAEDKLFATLDTTTRRLDLDENSYILLTDTVGFIRKLPHKLLDAFKSTLEEAVSSDALIIVADASDPYAADHIRIVEEILTELETGSKPTVIALNKVDKLDKLDEASIPFPIETQHQKIEISAKTQTGFDVLKACLKGMLFEEKKQYRMRIPFQQGNILSWLYQVGKVVSVDYEADASIVEVELDTENASRASEYIQ